MVIDKPFSKRQREIPDVYSYDGIPEALKVQIVHIWTDAIGGEQEYSVYKEWSATEVVYKNIVDILCREYGVLELPPEGKSSYEFQGSRYFNELKNYFLKEKDIEKLLDIIELTFQVIKKLASNEKYHYNAIDKLNSRFQEHGIGFQFVNNEIIKVDSELIHAKVVKPALRLLHKVEYQSAQQEFLSAYEHYMQGKYKESINDCHKSFESTMKIICNKRKWDCKTTDSAKELIKICFDNKLIPSFWQQHFNSLQSMLESSIPTGRNKLGAHGQGVTPKIIPDYLVSYMLHMTASTLVFLITAEDNTDM